MMRSFHVTLLPSVGGFSHLVDINKTTGIYNESEKGWG